jgi:peptidoglycan/xylan/chitin deacetylase (PgdA/CDA1 family)
VIPVLTFHALNESASPLSVPPRVFARGLEHLHERGWRTVSLGEIATRLEARKPLPERALAITFDDGFRSVSDEALPVLRALGYSATVFLAVGADDRAETMLPMDDRPMLTWSQARELRDAGWEIGAHSRTHPDLTRLPDERIESEMRGSQVVIEDRLGARVSAFAYPFGRHDRRTRAIARRHFACACATRLGRVGPESDRYALERIDAHYLRTDRLFRLLASRALPWYLRARAIPRAARATLARSRDARRA